MSWIFDETGIRPPQTPSGTVEQLATKWQDAARVAEQTMTDVTTVVWDVMEHNTGAATDAFSEHMRSSLSGAGDLNRFNGGAMGFSTAHASAAAVLDGCRRSMLGTALGAELAIAQARKHLDDPVPFVNWVLQRASTFLEAQQSTAMRDIASAYAAVSFSSGQSSRPDDRGRYQPETGRMWSDLTAAEREAIVQVMVDEMAEEYGLDTPVNVSIRDLTDPVTGNRPNGSWSESRQLLSLDIRNLEDPALLHTIAHEVRHAAQHQMIRDMNHDPGFIEQFMIDRGWRDHPFDRHDVDRATVEAWEENFADYRSTGRGDPWDRYAQQPVERDAREAGREFANELTPEELRRYADEAGVDLDD